MLRLSVTKEDPEAKTPGVVWDQIEKQQWKRMMKGKKLITD